MLDREVARLLGHPSRSGVGSNSGQVHPAGVELDEDQDVQPVQEDGVDGQKVRCQYVRRLSSKEGSPRATEPPTRRIEPSPREYAADRCGRDAHAETH
jgi:hypothetical protein